MALDELRPLPCPGCGGRHDLAVWLDTPGRCWRGGRQVEVSCTSCGGLHDVELQDGRLSIGPRTQGSGALRRPDLRIDQPGLCVQANPAGLRVTLGRREWFLPRPPRDSILDR